MAPRQPCHGARLVVVARRPGSLFESLHLENALFTDNFTPRYAVTPPYLPYLPTLPTYLPIQPISTMYFHDVWRETLTRKLDPYATRVAPLPFAAQQTTFDENSKPGGLACTRNSRAKNPCGRKEKRVRQRLSRPADYYRRMNMNESGRCEQRNRSLSLSLSRVRDGKGRGPTARQSISLLIISREILGFVGERDSRSISFRGSRRSNGTVLSDACGPFFAFFHDFETPVPRFLLEP